MPHGNYSWLGIATPKNVRLTKQAEQCLENEIEMMENSAVKLEGVIHRYHNLCKQYEIAAGSKKGEKICDELESLKKQIEQLSHQISLSLENSSDLTHLGD